MQVQRQQMPVTGAPQFVDGGQYTPNVVPVQFLNNTAQPVIYIQHQPVSNAMQYRGQNPPVYQPPQSATTQAQMTPTNQPQPTHQQQPPPQSHQPAPPQQYEKKRSSRIVIKDPESGRDVTDVILKKKESKAQANTQSNFTYAAPLPQGPDDTKAKEIRAQFAQQVAARLLPEKPTPVNQPPVKIENRKTEPPVAIATPELAIVKTEKPTQNGNINVQKINEPIVNQKPPVIIKKEPGETDTSVIAREKAELDPKSETSVPVVVSHNKKILQPKEKVNTEDKSKQQVSQKPIVPAQENKTEELENIDSVEKEIGLEKPGKDPVEVNTVIEETRKDEPTKNIKNIETKSSLTAEVIKEKVVEISEKLKELPQEAPVESKESELNKELPIESKNLPNESSLETKKSDKIESLVESKVHLKELPAEEKGLPKESPVVTKESSKEAPVLSKPLTKEATAESKGSSKENSEKPMKVDAGKQSLPSADVPAKEISSVDPSAQDAKKDPSAEKVAAQEPAKAKPADSTNTEDAVKAADSSSVNGSVNVVEETVTEVKEDVISSSPVVNGYDSNPGGSAFNPGEKCYDIFRFQVKLDFHSCSSLAASEI